jgi:hypothetical protein
MEANPEVVGYRWAALLSAVSQVCLVNQQDPSGLESNLGDLKVSLPLLGEVTFPWRFSIQDLLTEDPWRLADQFYRAYRRAIEDYLW